MGSIGTGETLGSIERSVSLEEAEALGLEAITDLGFSPVLEEWEDNDGGPTAWSCFLADGKNVKIARNFGYGKGNRIEARVGALFEALEHTMIGPAYFDPAEVFLRRAGDVAEGALAAEPSAAILADTPEQKLACWRYSSPSSLEEIDVPVYLSMPWYVEAPAGSIRCAVGDNFNYDNIARYSSTSASASGVNSDEAVVHAINEVIERDAFSLLLIHALLAEDESPAVVDSQSLPGSLRDLLSYVEEKLQNRVYLVDITTDVDVPSYLAYVTPTEDSLCLSGFGVSLNPRYAVYRALTELLQGHLFKPHKRPEADSLARLAPLRKYPSLYRCGVFDLTEPLSRSRSVAFRDRSAPAGTQAHLNELSRKLSAAGFSVYRRIVHSLDNGVTAVHVIVPGMERFMSVTSGVPVPPGERGMRAVRKS